MEIFNSRICVQYYIDQWRDKMFIRSIGAAAIALSFLAPVANATAIKLNHLADREIVSMHLVEHTAMNVGKAHCRIGTMLKKGRCVVYKIKKLPHMM